MKIKLINKTRYQDDDLRAIVRKACSAAGVSADCREITLRIGVSRLHVRGRATLPRERRVLMRGLMKLSIPYLESWKPGRHAARVRTHEELLLEVCQVALHEAMHLAGARHADMTDEQRYCQMPIPWVTEVQLRLQEKEPAAPREEKLAAARGARLEHAQAMLKKATTRSKRADTLLKKWERRVKLLQR